MADNRMRYRTYTSFAQNLTRTLRTVGMHDDSIGLERYVVFHTEKGLMISFNGTRFYLPAWVVVE